MSGSMNGFNAFGAAPQREPSPFSRDGIRYPKAYAVSSVTRQFAEDGEFPPEELEAIADEQRRWSWVEIDLGAIQSNVACARRCLGQDRRLMAVVKADAYGHGAVKVARTAIAAGANQLAVATVPEGIKLRRAGLTAPILVLSEPPIDTIPLLLNYNLMPSVYTPEFAISYAECADMHGLRAPFHLAVNTGMNRIGVRFDEAVAFLRQVSFHRALEQVGTFTHFATADCAETLDFNMQFRRFLECLESMRQAGFNPGIAHCANSAALLRYPETHLDMARFGIAMYGYHPCPETRGSFDLRMAMSVHARITAVNTPPMSEGVSYGMHYRSPGSVKICTVPIGYADGLPRALSGQTAFICNGQVCRQVGNICMDQCMFEVDMRSYGTRHRLDPQVGDTVLIAGSNGRAALPIDSLAELAGSIPHELCCAFSLRMPRIYR